MGHHLSLLQKGDLKAALDDIYEKFTGLIPRQETLVAFASCPLLMTCAEWLHMYDQYNTVVLDGGAS
jgi:hypothetical protein